MVEARRRFAIVAYAETLGGGAPARCERVAVAVATPGHALAAHGPAPSLSTLQRWLRRFAAGERSVAALIDRPSTGRPPKDIVGDVATYLRRLVRARAAKYRLFQVKSVTGRPRWERLTARVEGYCEAQGLPAPSKHAVRRFVLAVPPEERAIAAFGTKAARALVAPKAINPTDRAHELVFLDEVLLPTWVKVRCDKQRRWFASRAWAVFMIDAHSRAILGFWVKKPSAANATQLLHTHATALEVLAVVAGIILPELAHPESLTFARGEPGELRLDGSGNTAAAARQMAHKGTNATLGEAYAPWARGTMERYFQTLKERDLFDLTGDRDFFLPFDPDREDPRTTRTRVNADKRRMEPYKLEVLVESLGEHHHLVSAVQHAVEVYNNTPHRGIGGRTPLSLYEETAPPADADAGRRSTILGLFPSHRLTVEPRGVEANGVWYNSDALQQVYGSASVLVRRDPLARGVFVYPRSLSLKARTPALFVPTRDAWARALSPDDFTKAIRRDYERIRETINRARDSEREAVVGPAAAIAVKAQIAERAQQQDKARRRRGPGITADGEDTTATGRALLPARPVRRAGRGASDATAGATTVVVAPPRRGRHPRKVATRADAPSGHPVDVRRSRLKARGEAALTPTVGDGTTPPNAVTAAAPGRAPAPVADPGPPGRVDAASAPKVPDEPRARRGPVKNVFGRGTNTDSQTA